MSVWLPHSAREVVQLPGVIRAGGTDLMERLRHHLVEGPLVDLRDVDGLQHIGWRRFRPEPPAEGELVEGAPIDPDKVRAPVIQDAAPDGSGVAEERLPQPDEGLTIGARVTLAALARQVALQAHYPGIAQAAGGLATPQVRTVATLGGSLVQDVRCWYYRNPQFTCLKRGGSTCLAREGDHLFHSCFDTGPCAAPHPSTMGLALLAYGAEVEWLGPDGGGRWTLDQLLGDGTDARRHHRLPEGAVITAVHLPPPTGGEHACYTRTIARARAEWPLVETLVRFQRSGDTIQQATVVIGGVAPIPLRLPAVEQALTGGPLTDEAFAAAAALGAEGASPLPMTGYKVGLIAPTLRDALTRARDRQFEEL